jgi:hypothetical protein
MTRELAAACSEAVTTLVHGADVVPTFSIGSVDALREEVGRPAGSGARDQAARRGGTGTLVLSTCTT